ncbi:MAG: serine protease [Desulfobacteraceae bacterium]|nr:MAG: serine protease [Desulfobacteraceae bacterium]
MKHLFLYITVVISAILIGGEAKCTDLPESIEIVKKGVVQLMVKVSYLDKNTKNKMGGNQIKHIAGTGFLVSDDGHVVTALHVIEGMHQVLNTISGKKKVEYINIPIQPFEDARHNIVSGTFISIEFDVIDSDAEHDIALLKLKTNPFTKEFIDWSKNLIITKGREVKYSGNPLLLNTQRPKDGTSIAISGYPLQESSLVTTSGFIATPWASYENSSKPNTRSFDVYLADIQVNPGNSGGPVYLTSDCSVIGICVAHKVTKTAIRSTGLSIGTNSGLTVIIPTKYIFQILKKNLVKFKEHN